METLLIKCSRCLGTGIDNNIVPSVTCESCTGTGYVESSKIDNSIVLEELAWLRKKMKVLLKHLDLPED